MGISARSIQFYSRKTKKILKTKTQIFIMPINHTGDYGLDIFLRLETTLILSENFRTTFIINQDTIKRKIENNKTVVLL